LLVVGVVYAATGQLHISGTATLDPGSFRIDTSAGSYPQMIGLAGSITPTSVNVSSDGMSLSFKIVQLSPNHNWAVRFRLRNTYPNKDVKVKGWTWDPSAGETGNLEPVPGSPNNANINNIIIEWPFDDGVPFVVGANSESAFFEIQIKWNPDPSNVSDEESAFTVIRRIDYELI